MRTLRNVVYKSSNLIVQKLQEGSVSSNTAVVIGSGHSVSVDYNNNVTFTDPGFRPPKKITNYGTDCTLFTIYYPKTCKGLDVAGKELAEFINKNLDSYRKIILHGHSKCGCCFANLAQWLSKWSILRTHIITVSAPLRGTPFANFEGFSQKLNAIEKFFYRKIFSDHNVDRDISPNSKFISNLNLQSIDKLHREYIVSKCAPSLNPIDWILWLIDIRAGIHGDGIVPLDSQIPDGIYYQIKASHSTSMRNSCKIVRNLM